MSLLMVLVFASVLAAVFQTGLIAAFAPMPVRYFIVYSLLFFVLFMLIGAMNVWFASTTGPLNFTELLLSHV